MPSKSAQPTSPPQLPGVASYVHALLAREAAAVQDARERRDRASSVYSDALEDHLATERAHELLYRNLLPQSRENDAYLGRLERAYKRLQNRATLLCQDYDAEQARYEDAKHELKLNAATDRALEAEVDIVSP
jgi:hypothetical protein